MNPVSGLAAYLGRGEEDTLPKILWQMRRRATYGYTLYSECEDVCICDDVENSEEAKVGVCLRFKGELPPLPIHGEIYEPEQFDLERLHLLLMNGCFDEAAELLNSVDGAYSMIIVGKDEVTLIRDHLGQKPLYYTQKTDYIAAASEKAALEALGFDVIEAPKASILYLSYDEKQHYPIKVERGEPSIDNLDAAAEAVLKLLKRSLKARLSKSESTVLGFSGGLDSAILAKLASCEKNVKMLCIGIEGSRDLEWSSRAAELLGLDLEAYIIQVEDVKKASSRLRNTIFNPLNLSIAVGVELMASRAREEGYQSLMLGQLADELFGGYMRYQNAYKLKGVGELQKLMVEDVLSSQRGLERDEYASAPYVDLCLPYASKPLVEYALKIHPELKVDANRRKIVLRRAAEMLNLPREIVDAPKKALQYSTGIHKIIIEEARNPYNTSK
ncbi:MAG: asparagine synthase-related protein [Nitrososphaerales archaeon]